MKFFTFLLAVNICLHATGQTEASGVVADSISRQPLPFATVKEVGRSNSVITGINGRFWLPVASAKTTIAVSYIGYSSKSIPVDSLSRKDTVFISPQGSTLGEVIIRSNDEKLRRIINSVVKNKGLNNPEMYDVYQCNIYYKMKVDMVPGARRPMDSARVYRQGKIAPKDSARIARQRRLPARDSARRDNRGDSSFRLLGQNNHLLFSETFSKRLYKRPQQLQELVIASRFSGLKKTYFTNLVTDVLPFHLYGDYISLNGRDYSNPFARGWQQRYDFRLYDEIIQGNDTTYILTFAPKEKSRFNGLYGIAYINTDKYAISHFIGNTGDTTSQRSIRIEQVYYRVDGRWFPKELNYDLLFSGNTGPGLVLKMNGHSVIDSVSFSKSAAFRPNKTYSVLLTDSVDLHTEAQWERFRMGVLNSREKNTFRIIDSISQKNKLEKIVYGFGKLSIGRLPVQFIDIDLTRIVASNNYEKTRLGIGLYTNEKLSRYFSLGGWVGYGFRDKVIKYGMSGTLYVGGNKDNWLRAAVQEDYQNAGNIHIHPEIDRSGFRNWILAQVDRVKEYSFTVHTQKGYWEIEARGAKQKLRSLFGNNFAYAGKNLAALNVSEVGVGIRYAYGEKRVPLFGYYFSTGTRFPTVYFRGAVGKVTAGEYSSSYLRLLGAVSYSKRFNGWGKDAIRLEAGLVQSLNDKPFSRSFLLAAKGFRTDGLNYYAWGGFLTMRPYDYYSDKYVSVLLRHDFDRYLWRAKFSKPYISLAHNALYGGLAEQSRLANAGIAAPTNGYHESGIVLNQLLQKNLFNVSYIYLNAGAFYHWAPKFNWSREGIFVVGIAAGF